MKKVNFLRRLRNWVRSNESYYDFKTSRRITRTRRDVIESALRGECLIFLRTQAKSCSCSMCRGTKSRDLRSKEKQELKKIINEL